MDTSAHLLAVYFYIRKNIAIGHLYGAIKAHNLVECAVNFVGVCQKPLPLFWMCSQRNERIAKEMHHRIIANKEQMGHSSHQFLIAHRWIVGFMDKRADEV